MNRQNETTKIRDPVRDHVTTLLFIYGIWMKQIIGLKIRKIEQTSQTR